MASCSQSDLKANADVDAAPEARANWTCREAEVWEQFWEGRRELNARPFLGNHAQRTNVGQVHTATV